MKKISKQIQDGLWPIGILFGFLPHWLNLAAVTERIVAIILIFAYLALTQVLLPYVLKRKDAGKNTQGIVMLVMAVIMFINSTGAVNSPFFFLYYFTVIGLGFILEAKISILIAISLVAYYTLEMFFSGIKVESKSIINIISLLLMLPLAKILSSGLPTMRQQKQLINRLSVEKEQFKNVLGDIEQDIVSWTVFKIKSPMTNIKNYLYAVLGDEQEVNKLSNKQKLYLVRCYQDNEESLKLLQEFSQKASAHSSENTKPITSLSKQNLAKQVQK